MIARCACGKVEFATIGEPIIRAACHCADCSEGSRQIEALPGASPIRDPFGGTQHFLYPKDQVAYLQGAEHFKNIQVESDSPKRVYASCCHSYLFMDLPDPMQWVPISRNRFQGEVPPIEMRINAKFKASDPGSPTDAPISSAVPFRFVTKLLGSWFAMKFHGSARVAAVKGVYAAINRGDISAVLKFFDTEIERIEPEGFPSSGTYCGHAEVKAHLSQGRGTWAEGRCEPERIVVVGDKVVACLHVHVRLKDRTDWIDARFADGFTFRNGKITQMRTFAETAQALEWARIKD